MSRVGRTRPRPGTGRCSGTLARCLLAAPTTERPPVRDDPGRALKDLGKGGREPVHGEVETYPRERELGSAQIEQWTLAHRTMLRDSTDVIEPYGPERFEHTIPESAHHHGEVLGTR